VALPVPSRHLSRPYRPVGRLAWSAGGLRKLALILNFFSAPNLNYRKIASLEDATLLGETIYLLKGVPNPQTSRRGLTLVWLIVFVMDARIRVWLGERVPGSGPGSSLVFSVAVGPLKHSLPCRAIVQRKRTRHARGV
jgi:hypothetical protein